MITFIIPTRDKKKLEGYKLPPDSELIAIEGAKSFFDCWRQGIKKAKGEYLCLTHDDTEFIKIPNLDKIFKGNVGMIGVAGTTVLHKDQPWWFSEERFLGQLLSGSIYHREGEGKSLSVFGPYGEVVVLDGVCMITTKKILEDVGIPDKDYGTWDFYDHIISLEYLKKGYKLLTVPIEMIHDSKGGNKRQSFFDSLDKFRDEYLTQTWRI